jgi:hypothetical protein
MLKTLEKNHFFYAKVFMFFQLKLLKGDNSLRQKRLGPNEIKVLQKALKADYKNCKIRLREGEYQYVLAEAIASFQLELLFPDVKNIIERLYGEEKTDDVQFIRKIQTILKKMEKSNVVKILPKKKPWELQRYALSGFKFQDVDKNLVAFATDQQMEKMQNLLQSVSSQQTVAGLSNIKIKVCILVFFVVTSYMVVLWDLTQPTITPTISIPALFVAVAFSLILGKTLSQG